MRQLRKVLEIGRVNLLRQVRDRGDLFFVFVLHTIIIVALGLQFGGTARARLGVVAPVARSVCEPSRRSSRRVPLASKPYTTSWRVRPYARSFAAVNSAPSVRSSRRNDRSICTAGVRGGTATRSS